MKYNRFDCTECGTDVAVDEDGCCRTCGADTIAVYWQEGVKRLQADNETAEKIAPLLRKDYTK